MKAWEEGGQGAKSGERVNIARYGRIWRGRRERDGNACPEPQVPALPQVRSERTHWRTLDVQDLTRSYAVIASLSVSLRGRRTAGARLKKLHQHSAGLRHIL